MKRTLTESRRYCRFRPERLSATGMPASLQQVGNRSRPVDTSLSLMRPGQDHRYADRLFVEHHLLVPLVGAAAITVVGQDVLSVPPRLSEKNNRTTRFRCTARRRLPLRCIRIGLSAKSRRQELAMKDDRRFIGDHVCSPPPVCQAAVCRDHPFLSVPRAGVPDRLQRCPFHDRSSHRA